MNGLKKNEGEAKKVMMGGCIHGVLIEHRQQALGKRRDEELKTSAQHSTAPHHFHWLDCCTIHSLFFNDPGWRNGVQPSRTNRILQHAMSLSAIQPTKHYARAANSSNLLDCRCLTTACSRSHCYARARSSFRIKGQEGKSMAHLPTAYCWKLQSGVRGLTR